MKQIKIILSILLIALSLNSCEDDNNVTMSSDITPPVLAALTPENFVISESMNMFDKLAYWHWKSAGYGFQASVKYSVETDTIASFISPHTIGTVKTNSIDVTIEMLNNAGIAFTKESIPLTLFVRLKAVIDSDEFGASSPVTYSNIQQITFSPYISK